MRVQDIKIGEYYRIASSPNYGWIKPFKIVPAGEVITRTNIAGNLELHKFPYAVVECEHSVSKDDTLAIHRTLKAKDIIRDGDKK